MYIFLHLPPNKSRATFVVASIPTGLPPLLSSLTDLQPPLLSIDLTRAQAAGTWWPAASHPSMVKMQLGGLASLFSSSKDTGGAVLACPSSSSSMLSASSSSSSAWQWPSCSQPRTLSFRQQQEEEEVDGQDKHNTIMKQAYKTMNSAYFPDDSLDSFSTASGAEAVVDSFFSEAEAVIRGLRSDRLFFEPDASSSCILKQKPKLRGAADKADHNSMMESDAATVAAFGGATAMSVESQNPYRDFRESMEAMVMSHGVKDWRWLEEMLGWYLRANGKSTHGLIVGAFVDLLVSLSTTSPASSSTCSSSSSSL